MAGWSQQKKASRPPGRTLVLQPWVFADTWERRPAEPVCIGLRLMSDGAKGRARTEASRIALESHEADFEMYLDARNDLLVRLAVAHGICDPNDVTKPHPLLPYAEDEVRDALSSRGARFIHDALYRYQVESSPLCPEATDEELDELMTAIDDGTIDDLPRHRAALVRRFMGYALEEIRRALEEAAA